MFEKRNLLSRLWLKYTDKAAYKDYKWDLVNYRQYEYTNFLTGGNKLSNLNKIAAVTKATGKINVMHSGNAGDIIYALPTLKKIYELTQASIYLYFRLGRLVNLPNYNSHPLGGVMLNNKMADMLQPLLATQAYIADCGIYTDCFIDIDLDYFRSGLIPTNGNIARWCSYVTGVSPDLWKEWLTVTPNVNFANHIVVARSGRYQNKAIDYSFIKRYNKVVFIGIGTEYNDIRQFLPDIQWIEMDDFLQMAEIIAGCKLFIGNQSFPYAVAEALKVTRILEVSFEVINVIPEGKGGHDFFFQQHFESLVDNLYNGKASDPASVSIDCN